MSTHSEYEELYKRKGRDIRDLRQETKTTVKLQQSHLRERLLTSKRLKVDDLEAAEVKLSAEDEYAKVENATRLLKQGQKVEALTTLHRCFAGDPKNADTFIRCEGLQLLQSCFLSSDSEVLHAAAWCTVNLCAGDQSIAQKMMRFSPLLIQFLQGSDIVMQELCAWAIGNLAGDLHVNRQTLLQQGCIPHLTDLLSSKHCLTFEARTQSVLFALINLARDQSYACIKCMQENSVSHHIITMLTETSATCDLCFEIGWLTNCIYVRQETWVKHCDQYELILHHVIDKFSQIANLEDTAQRDKVILPYISCVANIIGLNMDLVDSVCGHLKFVNAVLLCLECQTDFIKKETLCLLQNAFVDPSARVLFMCQSRILKAVLNLCQSPDEDTALTALYLVEATTKVSTDLFTWLLQLGLLDSMTSLLYLLQHRIVKAALDVLTELMIGTSQGKAAFLESGALVQLQSLASNCTNEEVRKKAKSLHDLLSA